MTNNWVLLVLVVPTVAVANEQGLSGCGSELFREISFRDPYLGPESRVYTTDTSVIICLTNYRKIRQCFATR